MSKFKDTPQRRVINQTFQDGNNKNVMTGAEFNEAISRWKNKLMLIEIDENGFQKVLKIYDDNSSPVLSVISKKAINEILKDKSKPDGIAIILGFNDRYDMPEIIYDGAHKGEEKWHSISIRSLNGDEPIKKVRSGSGIGPGPTTPFPAS